MKQPKIKSMKYEDFKDNEYLEQLRANGTDIIVGCLDDLINWGRSMVRPSDRTTAVIPEPFCKR